MVRQDQLDLKDLQALKDLPVQQGQQDPQDHTARLVQRDLKDLPVQQVQQDPQDRMVQLVQRDLKALRD